jgi:hypothetical protein
MAKMKLPVFAMDSVQVKSKFSTKMTMTRTREPGPAATGRPDSAVKGCRLLGPWTLSMQFIKTERSVEKTPCLTG